MLEKVVIIGIGSIGKRHLRNLKELDCQNLIACDPNEEALADLSNELGLKQTYTQLEQVPLEPGDVVFICSPNHLHATQAIFAAKAKCHIFIEKPVAHTMDDREELCELIDKNNLTTLCGCNMRFYPAIANFKNLLKSGLIGNVLSYKVEAGIYLPSWRPHLDYRKNYGAHKSQGGGVVLDMIHEIDYAHWLFGDPQSISAIYEKVSDLEIDTEDVAELNLRHEGYIGNLHLDYISRKYTRRVHAIGEKGNLYWDWHAQGISHYDAETQKDTFYPIPEHYDLNSMYLDEEKHFLNAIKSGEETEYPVKEAYRVLEIALAAKQSSDQKATISLQETLTI